jgi:hypothetical protein
MTTEWATKVAGLQMVDVDTLSEDECMQLRRQIRTMPPQVMNAIMTGALTPNESRRVCVMLVEKDKAAAQRAQLLRTKRFF